MKNTPFLAAFAALLLPFASLAQNADQLVEVKASGYGETVREAYKAALRAAVEQVVGTLIDATTLVENDELIENEILTYAPGMVASAKQIGEPKKLEGGIYIAKVLATVKKGQIEQKLRAASTVNVTLDGADLFARMTAAKENLADAEKMIAEVLGKYVDCVKAEPAPGENGKSALDLDPKSGEIIANVRVRIDQAQYRLFVKEILEKLGPMAERNIPFEGKDSGGGSRYWRFKPQTMSYLNDDNILLVIDSLRGLQAHCLFFDKNKFTAIHNEFLAGKYPEIGSRLAIRVVLRDTFSDVLSTKIMNLPNDNLSVLGQLSWYKDTKTASCVIGPFCGGHFDSDGDFEKKACWTDRVLRIPLGKFSADELKNAGRLEIKVVHMKDGQFVE